MKAKRMFWIPISVCLFIILGVIYYYLFTSMSKSAATEYVYIDSNDNIDSVTAKLTSFANSHSLATFTILARHGNYAKNIRTGRYAIKPGVGSVSVFRTLKNGLQTPISLTITPVRTISKLSAELSKKLMLDSVDIYNALTDEASCKKLGFDTTTVISMFLPNTYDMYWNISVDNLLSKMKKEYIRFWNDNRIGKAKQIEMTPIEVMTLASIIDEETANNDEKPRVAGMYYNRLKLRNKEYPEGMPLQADPTIKFALKDFGLRRIYFKHLNIDNPFNTYKRTGLPPGPIRIPSLASIDAVLNHENHGYLYMCAKEDFSGTHNFAVTYEEHKANAIKYSRALNERGIK